MCSWLSNSCGVASLATRPSAGRIVLAQVVRSSGGVRHGRQVSHAALPPLCPRHLACPAHIDIECQYGKRCRVSKRDARCWFDQRRLPDDLRRWMARPPVSSEELAAAGVGVAEQKALLQPGEEWRSGLPLPISHGWPMGFIWSPFVAQEELLGLCHDAGLGLVMRCAYPVRFPACLLCSNR